MKTITVKKGSKMKTIKLNKNGKARQPRNKTAEQARDIRDKLLIAIDLVKQDFGKKYLTEAISFLDNIADEATI